MVDNVDNADIPSEVLNAINGIDDDDLVENTTKPTKEVLAQHESNLKEAEGKELRPDVKEEKKKPVAEDFKCYRDKMYGMWHIKRADGNGSIPAKLKGGWTELALAQRAINEYIVGLDKVA